MTLTRRFAQKKNGVRDPPPKKIISKHYFFSISISPKKKNENPIFFCTNLLVRVKLGYYPNLNFLVKPLLGEKYVEGKRRKKERIMPSLVATMSTLARSTCMRCACTMFAPIKN